MNFPPAASQDVIDLALSYDEANDEGIRRGFISRKYCPMCKNYKPPRTHHCRLCNKCVIKVLIYYINILDGSSLSMVWWLCWEIQSESIIVIICLLI